MSTDTPRSQESTGTVSGPHFGRGRDGERDHRYWRCEQCGLESTDPRLREECFRCRASEARSASNSERCSREQSEASPAANASEGEETDARRA